MKNLKTKLYWEQLPSKIEVINDDDDEGQKSRKYIMNEFKNLTKKLYFN